MSKSLKEQFIERASQKARELIDEGNLLTASQLLRGVCKIDKFVAKKEDLSDLSAEEIKSTYLLKRHMDGDGSALFEATNISVAIFEELTNS